jgi:hypothetical protein
LYEDYVWVSLGTAMKAKQSKSKVAACMHASIACLLLHEDYVLVSLGNAMKAKQMAASATSHGARHWVVLCGIITQ